MRLKLENLIAKKYKKPPTSWNEIIFPKWIPERIRIQIKEFWGCAGRTPTDWAEDSLQRGAPPFGEVVTLKACQDKKATGRYVHAWNNMGRVVHGSEYTVVSFHDPTCPFSKVTNQD